MPRLRPRSQKIWLRHRRFYFHIRQIVSAVHRRHLDLDQSSAAKAAVPNTEGRKHVEHVEPAYGTATLLLIAVAAVAALLFLILRFRIHAFVSLVLVSLATALVARIPFTDVVPALLQGFGSTLAT